MTALRSPPRSRSRYRLHPLARAWLKGGDDAGPMVEEGPDWSVWLLGRLAADRVTDLGGVLVDHAVLEQRFSCVSERCAPGHREPGTVSCCADVELSPSPAEHRRLARLGPDLEAWMKRREPRLRDEGAEFWRSDEGAGICRPGGRCAFSGIDGGGRIRCRLHAFAKEKELPREEVQPLACRLFPLILVDRGDGRVALTVVSRDTYKLVSTHRPQKYPCLRDASLPYLTDSMAADLDWLFGEGFARALADRRNELGIG